MEKVKNLLSGLMDYVVDNYFNSLYYSRWEELVWLFGLLAALLVFIKSNGSLILTIATPFVGLLVFQVIKFPVFIVKFFYNVLRDLIHEEVSFLYFYKN